MQIANQTDARALCGGHLRGRKVATVTAVPLVRGPNGNLHLAGAEWFDPRKLPEGDHMIVNPGENGYPCRMDVFLSEYKVVKDKVLLDEGFARILWHKPGITNTLYFQIPATTTEIVVATLEGPVSATALDWIAVGPVGEVYPIKDEVMQRDFSLLTAEATAAFESRIQSPHNFLDAEAAVRWAMGMLAKTQNDSGVGGQTSTGAETQQALDLNAPKMQVPRPDGKEYKEDQKVYESADTGGIRITEWYGPDFRQGGRADGAPQVLVHDHPWSGDLVLPDGTPAKDVQFITIVLRGGYQETYLAADGTPTKRTVEAGNAYSFPVGAVHSVDELHPDEDGRVVTVLVYPPRNEDGWGHFDVANGEPADPPKWDFMSAYREMNPHVFG